MKKLTKANEGANGICALDLEENSNYFVSVRTKKKKKIDYAWHVRTDWVTRKSGDSQRVDLCILTA